MQYNPMLPTPFALPLWPVHPAMLEGFWLSQIPPAIQLPLTSPTSPKMTPIPKFAAPTLTPPKLPPDDETSQSIEAVATSLGRTDQGYRCIYCRKIYSRKYGLKIHLRTHTGFKPLKCRICSRAFSDPSNLNKHTRLHAEQTAVRCHICGKGAARGRDLERHMLNRHPEVTKQVTEYRPTSAEDFSAKRIRVSVEEDRLGTCLDAVDEDKPVLEQNGGEPVLEQNGGEPVLEQNGGEPVLEGTMEVTCDVSNPDLTKSTEKTFFPDRPVASPTGPNSEDSDDQTADCDVDIDVVTV